MKIRFYCDIEAGDSPARLAAWTEPGVKGEKSARFAFDVEIPEAVFVGRYEELPGIVAEEVIDGECKDIG